MKGSNNKNKKELTDLILVGISIIAIVLASQQANSVTRLDPVQIREFGRQSQNLICR